MHIREIETSDAAEWLRMRTALWPSDDHPGEIDDFFSARPFAVFVAARPSGGLAGFVEVGSRSYAEGCESSPVAYIEGWYVDPDVRRAGVGASLIRAAEDWARANGFREIGSDVELHNEISVAAHRALGYEETDRIVCFRRDL